MNKNFIINITKSISKKDLSLQIKRLRPQLLSVLDRLIISCNSKVWFSTDQNKLRRLSTKVIDEMLLQILNNRREGLTQFKEKVNYVIHYILLGEPDSYVPRKFRLGKHYFKLIKMILLTHDEKFKLNRRNIVISILQI